MSAQYEKRVLGFDAWLQKQGDPSFCKVLSPDKVMGAAITGVMAVMAGCS